MRQPTLSIIVAIYNVENYLKKCIESILASSYTNYELLLVDDGSTDGSANICDAYAQRDKRIRVIHKSNGGLVSSRKKGGAEASGEYLIFIDGDDEISCDYIANIMERIIVENPDLLIHGGSVENKKGIIVADKPTVKAGIYVDESRLLEVESSMFYPLFKQGNRNRGYIHNSIVYKAIKREIFIKSIDLINDDVSLGEDMCFSVAMFLANPKKIIVVPDEVGYIYHYNQSSMSRNQDVGMMDRFISNLWEISLSTEKLKKELCETCIYYLSTIDALQISRVCDRDYVCLLDNLKIRQTNLSLKRKIKLYILRCLYAHR